MPASATLLVVEDDPGDAYLVQRAFAKAGISNPVKVVRDGEEAVSYLAGRGAYQDRTQFPLPTVVLLDLKLPRRSGLEVLAWIREQPGLSRLRVVILTSSRESPDVAKAYDLGVSSYLVEPVEHDKLVEMMASMNEFLIEHSESPNLGPAV